MPIDAVTCLACPQCGAPLEVQASGMKCAEGHSFDVARQGYVSLLHGDAKLGTADSLEMVEARSRVQSSGAFAPLAKAIATVSAEAVGEARQTGGACVVDVGAGTGYYLAEVLGALPGDAVGVALDISKFAARRAARVHPRVVAAVADTWRRLPIADARAALVLDVFAPRNAEEFARVLCSDGAFVVASALPGHLAELVGPLGLIEVDESKDQRLADKFGERFELSSEGEVAWTMSLDRPLARDIAMMGPSAHHLDPGVLDERVATLAEPLSVQGRVRLGVYRVRPRG